jgi:hypothetical protein
MKLPLKIDQTFASLLLGKPKATTLENRVFNAVAMLAGLTGLLTLAQNLVLELPFIHSALSIIAIFVGAFFYTWSLKSRKYKPLVIPIFTFFLGLIVASWFATGGSLGPTSFIFFNLFISGTILFKKPRNILFLGSTLLIVIVLLMTEYFKPDTIWPYFDRSQRFLDVGITLVVCLGITGALVHLVTSEHQRERDLNEQLYQQTLKDKEALEKALKEIRVLKGLIPICANCKKIRDDQGFWHQVESYIAAHAEVAFTHGICPECKLKLYPEFFGEKKE